MLRLRVIVLVIRNRKFYILAATGFFSFLHENSQVHCICICIHLCTRPHKTVNNTGGYFNRNAALFHHGFILYKGRRWMNKCL